MTITEKILIIIACAALLIFVVWLLGVRKLLKRLKSRTKETYKVLCCELDKLYAFTDKAAAQLTDYSEDFKRIMAVKSEAQDIKDRESRAECDAILQSRLNNVLEKSQNADLIAEYSDIEIDISGARKKYNAAVREYNCQRKSFPDRIVSALFRYKSVGFYTADQADE